MNLLPEPPRAPGADRRPDQVSEPAPSVFGTLGAQARVDFRMLTDGHVTQDQELALLAELKDWRETHRFNNRPCTVSRCAELIGLSPSILSELNCRRYPGDKAAMLRKLDQFLADERAKAGRLDLDRYVSIRLSRIIFGTLRAGLEHNTMPVVIGPPGCGKSAAARAFAASRLGVVMIRCDDEPTDRRVVTELICEAIPELRKDVESSHRVRFRAIKAWFARHGGAMLIVDECQKLSRNALEILRDLHDASDPTGARALPIALFGDQRFYDQVIALRGGKRTTPIAPQMIRRMVPLLDVEQELRRGGDGGTEADGQMYTAEEIAKVLANERVKLVDRHGLRFLADLANTSGYGHIGFALRVVQVAYKVMHKAGDGIITVAELQAALEATAGRTLAVEIDARCGGTLLAKVG